MDAFYILAVLIRTVKLGACKVCCKQFSIEKECGDFIPVLNMHCHPFCNNVYDKRHVNTTLKECFIVLCKETKAKTTYMTQLGLGYVQDNLCKKKTERKTNKNNFLSFPA